MSGSGRTTASIRSVDDFENNCARKIACGIDVTVTNAKGSVKDHGTVIIPARGQTPSGASYSIPTLVVVGVAQTARNRRFVVTVLPPLRPPGTLPRGAERSRSSQRAGSAAVG